MFKKTLASLAVVLLTVGMSVVGIAAPAGAAPPGGGTYPPTDAAANDPGNWEVLPGEACYKIEPVNAVPYPLPSPGVDRQFSKVIVKAGSGDGSNLVLTDGLAEGTAVQHNLKDSISHLILCTVPTPPTSGVASALVTTTPATCSAAESDVVVAVTNAIFSVDYPTATTYRVTATATGNNFFSSGDPTLVIEGAFAPKLVEGCETPPAPGVASASVTTTPATCSAAESDVVVKVTNATFALAYPTATTYRVTANATGNNFFSNGTPTSVIEGAFAPKLVEGCELPSFALVTPTFSVTQPTCTTTGSYTLGSVVGELVWTVNGKPGVASGTYPAPADYSAVTITAAPAVEGDGLDPDWVNPVVLRFAAPAGVCSFNPPTLPLSPTPPLNPPTLAFTGLTIGAGISLAGGLLFVGLAGLFVARHRRLHG